MSHRITFTVNDGFYEAARQEARKQGRDNGATDGVGSLAKGALRAYLSRNGYSVAELDKPDRDAVPAGRSAYTESAEDRARTATPMTGGDDTYRDRLQLRAHDEQVAKEMEQGL